MKEKKNFFSGQNISNFNHYKEIQNDMLIVKRIIFFVNAIKIKIKNVSSIVNNYKSHHFPYIFIEKETFSFLYYF